MLPILSIEPAASAFETGGYYTRTLLRSRYCGLAGFEIMQKTIRPEIGAIKSVYLCAVTSNTGYRLANGLNVSTGEPAAIGK